MNTLAEKEPKINKSFLEKYVWGWPLDAAKGAISKVNEWIWNNIKGVIRWTEQSVYSVLGWKSK